MEKYLWVLISGLKPKNEKSISRILTKKRGGNILSNKPGLTGKEKKLFHQF